LPETKATHAIDATTLNSTADEDSVHRHRKCRLETRASSKICEYAFLLKSADASMSKQYCCLKFLTRRRSIDSRATGYNFETVTWAEENSIFIRLKEYAFDAQHTALASDKYFNVHH
jgi:hypothetical protein